MKITKKQLRKLILKEFLNTGGQQFNFKDFDRLGSGSGSGFLPPFEPPRGGGGGGGKSVRCYDNSLYDETYNKVLDAFNDYLYMIDISEYEYQDIHGIIFEEAIDIMSNIAMSVCTGSLNIENIIGAFNDPTGYL